MRVGFTGTQRGMTGPQAATLERMLRWAKRAEPDSEFHHGDCDGADDQAHDIAVDVVGLEPVIHPPKNPAKRAFKKAARILKPKPYLTRNHDIVDDTQRLIATPGEREEQLRSGTWATVRYARKLRRKVTIIYPEGDWE